MTIYFPHQVADLVVAAMSRASEEPTAEARYANLVGALAVIVNLPMSPEPGR